MRITTLPSTTAWLYEQQGRWDHNPPYQRPGGQWGTRQKRRFIDSLLNNFPVPPIYLHRTGERRYAVVDGKQRLETIREFIDGGFALAPDFSLLDRADRLGSGPRPGERFGDFADDWRNELLGYSFTVIEVAFALDENADALVREIFLRLNSGTRVSRADLARVRDQLRAAG